MPIDPKLLNLFSLFWSMYHAQTQETSHQSPALPPSSGAGETRRVDERLDQLLLVVQAIWSLVQEKTGLTDADLMKRVTELDAADGTPDGRVTRPLVPCGKCGAAVSRKFMRCLFCGEPYEGGNAFDAV